MARVTYTEVLSIMDEVSLTEAQVLPYITGATALVDKALVGKGLSDELLKEIERWLSAHMIALTRERTAKSEEAGGAKIVYAGEWGKHLESTSYGQMVLTLDTTGALRTIMESKQAVMKAIKA